MTQRLSLQTIAIMLRQSLTKSILAASRPQFSPASQLVAGARGYHEKVISHYEKPRNVCFTSVLDWDLPGLELSPRMPFPTYLITFIQGRIVAQR